MMIARREFLGSCGISRRTRHRRFRWRGRQRTRFASRSRPFISRFENARRPAWWQPPWSAPAASAIAEAGWRGQWGSA